MVDIVPPAWPRKKTLRGKYRKVTRISHLEKEGCEKVQVCRKMFYATLGLTGDRIKWTVLSKTKTSWMANISDKRGKHTPSIQEKDEISQLIITPIQKSHPYISHY